MRKLSKKRANQNAKYLRMNKKFLENNRICAAKVDGCTGMATATHHKRGRIGDLLTDESNFLAVCNNCHRWIELNPVEAKMRGFSKSRLAVENSCIHSVDKAD